MTGVCTSNGYNFFLRILHLVQNRDILIVLRTSRNKLSGFEWKLLSNKLIKTGPVAYIHYECDGVHRKHAGMKDDHTYLNLCLWSSAILTK